ncbi:MAG: phosphate/phosphite/phosphonate ABC transporter substrate-binding protein, partial [Pseudomonadota bacterium]
MCKTLRAIVVFALITAACTAHAEIKLGVLAHRGPETTMKEWGALADYLSAEMGEKVTVIPVKFSQFLDFCDAEKAAFIFANPWYYVRAKVLKNAKALATVEYEGAGTRFGGVIIARKDSGITKVQDMVGKVVMVPRLQSPGGWLFQKGVIVEAGISPEKQFKALLETAGESHDEVVISIKERKAEVGTVRTGILEAMQREGKISLSEFNIINKIQHPDFPFVCCTPLYPDWPIAALGEVPAWASARMER